MLTSETKRRIDACRDVLVGKLPLPTDQVELITLALIYKFMDDLDEESVAMGGRRSFFTGALAPYRWRQLLPQTVSAEQRLNLFAAGVEAIGKAEHLPGLFRDIFRNAFLKFRDGRILTMFLTEINAFAYSHSEELGNAFEYLLQCMGTQGENGQFRTPRHIIDFIVACLDPQPGDKILDPACGTGGFLVSAYKHILAKHTSPGSSIPGDKLTHTQRQQVYANLGGYDITDLMVKLSKVNLFLHGFPDPAIHIYDSLSNDARWSEKADLILANPPFMTPKGGVTPHTKFRIAAKKAEVLFTDYIAEHLTADGRGGIIVPNGIVATTQNAYVKLRRFLVEDSLVAVVSLPSGVFKPYSGVKTSILFLDKKLARKTKEMLFLKITADGFDLGDQRTPNLAVNDLPEAERVMKAWLKGEHIDTNLKGSGIVRELVERRGLLAEKDVPLGTDDSGESAVNDLGKLRRSREYKWPTVFLSEVCETITDGDHLPPPKSAAGIPFITISNITENRQIDFTKTFFVPSSYFENLKPSRKPRRGDVLYTVTGSFGIPVLIESDFEFCFQRHIAILRPGAKIDGRFLALVLDSVGVKEQANRTAVGAAQKTVSLTSLRSFTIPLPPLEEQQRIVAEIEGYQQEVARLEAGIATKREQIQTTIDSVWNGESA